MSYPFAAYLHGASIDDPLAMVRMENNKAVVYYYIKDHLGSVKALVDENGNPVQEYEYGAYGKTKVGRVTDSSPTNFVENRYAYTSREWEEETGDYYYRARYYDPSEGRFLSEDPIGIDAGDTNLYRYVFNSSINESDPMGLQAVGAIGGIIRTITVGSPAIMCNDIEEMEKDLRDNLLRKCAERRENDIKKCSKLPPSTPERNACFRRVNERYFKCTETAGKI